MCTSSPLSFSLIDMQFSKVIISQYTFRFVTYIDVICIKISTKKVENGMELNKNDFLYLTKIKLV